MKCHFCRLFIEFVRFSHKVSAAWTVAFRSKSSTVDHVCLALYARTSCGSSWRGDPCSFVLRGGAVHSLHIHSCLQSNLIFLPRESRIHSNNTETSLPEQNPMWSIGLWMLHVQNTSSWTIPIYQPPYHLPGPGTKKHAGINLKNANDMDHREPSVINVPPGGGCLHRNNLIWIKFYSHTPHNEYGAHGICTLCVSDIF